MGASSSSDGGDDRACRQCGAGGRDVPADATGASFLHTAAGKALVANLVSGKLTRKDLERLFDAFDADTDGALPAADAQHMFRALVSAVTSRASQPVPDDAAAAAPEEVSAYHARMRVKGAGAAAADEALIVAEWQREFGAGAKALTKDEFTAKGGGGLYAALKKGLAAAAEPAAPAAAAVAAASAPAPDTAAAARAPTVAGASATTAAGAGAPTTAASAATPAAAAAAGSPEVRGASASMGEAGRGAAMSTVSVSGPGGVVDMVAAQNRGQSPSVGPWADRSASNSVQGDGAGAGAGAGTSDGDKQKTAERQATAQGQDQGDAAVRQASTVSVADSTRGMSPSVAITHMTSKLVEAQEKAVENMHHQP